MSEDLYGSSLFGNDLLASVCRKTWSGSRKGGLRSPSATPSLEGQFGSAPLGTVSALPQSSSGTKEPEDSQSAAKGGPKGVQIPRFFLLFTLTGKVGFGSLRSVLRCWRERGAGGHRQAQGVWGWWGGGSG